MILAVDPAFASLHSLATAIRTGQLSPVEAVEATVRAIDERDGEINSCCEVRAELALAEARRIADRLARGDDPGPLAGIPIGVKDLEDAAGFRTTYGDPVHAKDPVRARDSVEVARLRAAGCVVVAKTNTPAYGFHAETDNLVFGPTRNPRALSRTAGGSSGGSAAAVAAGIFTLCTGSDGGGSIRIPSAVCGLSGFKVTNGVVPSGDDTAPTWGPFSTRGPMARSFAEIARALDVVAGFSPRDLLSFDLPGSFTDAVARRDVRGVRIAFCPKPGVVDPEPRVVDVCRAALARLEAAGAVVEEVDAVFPEPPVLAWVRRAAAGSWRVASADPTPWPERFLPEATGVASMGEQLTAGDLLDAEAGAHRAGLALAALFERVDVLATPAMGGPPPRVREPHPLGPGWAGDFTLPFNLTRSPAAVVGAGTVVDDGDELPIALQLAGPRCSDLRLLAVAAAAEEVLAG